jgi:hypothetical protein
MYSMQMQILGSAMKAPYDETMYWDWQSCMIFSSRKICLRADRFAAMRMIYEENDHVS